MRILVDGDSFTDKAYIKELAFLYQIEMIIFTDYAHSIDEKEYQVRLCEIGKDSVDMVLIREVQPKDIVITQDYGLASLVLSKGARVLHVSGMIIDQSNIDGLMLQRFIGYKQRRKDKHLKGPRKRTENQRDKFLGQLKKLIEER